MSRNCVVSLRTAVRCAPAKGSEAWQELAAAGPAAGDAMEPYDRVYRAPGAGCPGKGLGNSRSPFPISNRQVRAPESRGPCAHETEPTPDGAGGCPRVALDRPARCGTTALPPALVTKACPPRAGLAVGRGGPCLCGASEKDKPTLPSQCQSAGPGLTAHPPRVFELTNTLQIL